MKTCHFDPASTVFTCPVAALEEAEFLARETGRQYAICMDKYGIYRVVLADWRRFYGATFGLFGPRPAEIED